MQDFGAPDPVSVGAHEFRNRFGLYMERAAGGAEISVSRHGRPYVRLVPAALNPSIPGADE
jgi:prevent-host-death family protein